MKKPIKVIIASLASVVIMCGTLISASAALDCVGNQRSRYETFILRGDTHTDDAGYKSSISMQYNYTKKTNIIGITTHKADVIAVGAFKSQYLTSPSDFVVRYHRSKTSGSPETDKEILSSSNNSWKAESGFNVKKSTYIKTEFRPLDGDEEVGEQRRISVGLH